MTPDDVNALADAVAIVTAVVAVAMVHLWLRRKK